MAFVAVSGLDFFFFSVSNSAFPFSSADLKFKMTLGREEGSGQTNLPWLSCVGQPDIGVDRGGKIGDRRPKIKTGVEWGGSQRCREGKNSNKSLPHLFCLDMFTSR